MDRFALASVSAFLASLALTWVVRRLARAAGVLDVPDGVRKLHRGPVPLLGGVAVSAAWLLGLAVGAHGSVTLGLSYRGGLRPSFLLAAGIVLVTGVLDDWIGLRARWKFLGQSCAALALVGSGLVVQRLWLFDRTVELGWLGFALTVVWLVGSMNALNMLDGLDGLATTVGIILCLTLAGMAWLTQVPYLVLVSLTFAGALAGFLVYNFPPARIFLGDAGSSLIGLVIGAVALDGSFKAPATAALAAPILVLTLPIFDGLVAVVRRRLTGVPITAPDRGHIHNYLQQRGWNNLQVLAGVTGLCVLTGSLALLNLYFRNQAMAVLATAAVIIGSIMARFFGYYEYLLLVGGPRLLGTALYECLRLERPLVLTLCYRLKQCRSAEQIWAVLTEQAGLLQFTDVRLQLAYPRAFRAHWKTDRACPELASWSASLPLIASGKCVGQLSLRGYQRQKTSLPALIFMTVVVKTLAAASQQIPAADDAGSRNARRISGLDHEGEIASEPAPELGLQTEHERRRLSA
jgi:UDP-GlcNAc:undecaprenyl-phosphate/decaprenyl-phosphate GlcNAc-1-phosphate transferase